MTTLPHTADPRVPDAAGPDAHLLLLLARPAPGPERVERARRLAAARPPAWAWVADQAERHRLAPLVRSNLGPLAGAGPDPAVRERLDAAHRRHAGANRVLLAAASDLLAAAAGAGVEVLLRKGGHLAQLVYPDPATRPMSDLDVLVRPGAGAALVDVLGDLGYVEGTPDADGTVQPLGRRQRIFWHLYGSDLPKLNLVTGDPDRPVVSVDVNTSLLLPGKQYALPVGDVLDRAVTAVLPDGRRALVADPEDTVLDLCLHLYKNATTLLFMRAGKHRRLLKYVDVAEAVRVAGPRFSWDRLVARAVAAGVHAPLFHALSHVALVFPDAVAPEALAALRARCPDPDRFLRSYGQWDLPEPAVWSSPLHERLFDPGTDREMPEGRSLL